MKGWIVALVLGVPSAIGGLLLVLAMATVVSGMGDPLQPLLGALEPNLPLAIGLWLAGAGLALAMLLVMAWFAPWGLLFRRRPPRQEFRTGEKNQA